MPGIKRTASSPPAERRATRRHRPSGYQFESLASPTRRPRPARRSANVSGAAAATAEGQLPPSRSREGRTEDERNAPLRPRSASPALSGARAEAGPSAFGEEGEAPAARRGDAGPVAVPESPPPLPGLPKFFFDLVEPEPQAGIPHEEEQRVPGVPGGGGASSSSVGGPLVPAGIAPVAVTARASGVRLGTESALHRPAGPGNVQVPARSEPAKVGFELEIAGVTVHPSQMKGTVLLQGKGWRLETDLSKGKTNLEWVTDPLADADEVERVADELIALSQRLRDVARASPSQDIALKDVFPEAEVNCTLQVDDIRFGAHMQSTYGVGLAKIPAAIRDLHEPEDAARIESDTQKVLESHRQAGGPELSAHALGFIELLCMYQARADGGNRSNTVHAHFRMMTRSDFCAIHDQLLDDTDRRAIARILQGQPPVFMQALALDDDARVFKRPYVTERLGEFEEGPRVKDWLSSIVQGRSHGKWRKDLLSPPPGHGVHAGRSRTEGGVKKDYGMGARGIDNVNKLVIFEVRGTRDRPDRIPMNAQLKRNLLREYRHACDYNPALPPVAATSPDDGRYGFCGAAEQAWERLSKLRRQYHGLGPALVLPSTIDWVDENLQACQEAALACTDKDMSRAWVQRIEAMRQLIGQIRTSRGEDVPHLLDVFDHAVDDFDEASWAL